DAGRGEPMADKAQQTEKPTPRRLEKARREGQFPVSKEFVTSIQFLAFVVLLTNYGADWLSNLVVTSRLILASGFHTDMTPAALLQLLLLMTTRLALPMLK